MVLVASGKGGVGKSSVTVNLAAALAATGLTVGVLDADIWGFSVPRMLGVSGRLAGEERDGKKLMVPHERTVGDGLLRIISMGFLVEDEEQALMWRGLMLNRGVTHFLQDVAWGDDLDYLLIDMPPGTGDVQMGVAKLLPRAEVIVVTTPAAGRAEGGQPGRVDGPQELPARGRRDREHERLHLRPRHDLHASSARAAAPSWPPTPACRCSARSRSSRRCPPAATPASRSCSATGRPPRPSGPSPTASSPRPSRPAEMAGCSARMLDAAVAALDELDSAAVGVRQLTSSCRAWCPWLDPRS